VHEDNTDIASRRLFIPVSQLPCTILFEGMAIEPVLPLTAPLGWMLAERQSERPS